MSATWVYSSLHQRFVFYLCCLLMAAFFVSQALMSITLLILLSDGLIIGLSKWKTLKSKPGLLNLFLLGFAITMIAGIVISEDKKTATDVFLLKLPFLLFPLLLLVFKQLSQRLLVKIATVYIYCVYFTACVSAVIYINNKSYFDLLILQAKSIPITFGYGVFHIQFSVMLALAVLLGSWLLWKPLRSNPIPYKIFFYTITGLNFIFLHILSARTGLIGLYLVLFIVVFGFLLKNHTRKLIYFTSGLILLFVLIYHFSDALQNRFKNSKEDLKVVLSMGNPNEHSLATRIEAWRITALILKDNPMLGIGLGDVQNKMWEKFPEADTRLQPRNYKKPHNQFLETALHGGIPAMIFLIGIFLIYYRQYKKYILVRSVLLLFCFSLFFESMLERQVSALSIAFFLAFIPSLSERSE